MLLTHNRLAELVQKGVIENVKDSQINAASIDLTLGHGFKIEAPKNSVVDLAAGQSINMIEIESESIILQPGDWCLATTQQVFNLPAGKTPKEYGFWWAQISIGVNADNAIAAEYKLKSSMARNGLNHMLAGWCDPGWHGSELTLELHNINKYHSLKLTEGMKIGQVIFFEGDAVPDGASYAVKGKYNGQRGATSSRGIS